MTFAEVFDWCKKHQADVRGYRPRHGNSDLA